MATPQNDTLNVQRGTVSGAGGDDTYVFSDNLTDPNADITITDTQGTNKLQFVGLTVDNAVVASSTLQLTLSNGAQVTILDADAFTYEIGGNPVTGDPGTEKDFATFAQDDLGTGVPAEGDNPNTNSNVDNVVGGDGAGGGGGTEGDDELVGTDGSDTLNGLAGNDRLTGLGGADTLNGGDGFDTADYSDSPSAVTVDLAAGTGRGGDAEGDTLSSIEGVIGSRFADTLEGGAGDDFLEGGAGNDVLEGGAGFDTVGYGGSPEAVRIDLAAGTFSGGHASGDTIASDVEAISGSRHDDTLVGAGDTNLRGQAGADTLTGGDGRVGFEGNFEDFDGDTITNFDTDDTIRVFDRSGDGLSLTESVVDGDTILELSDGSSSVNVTLVGSFDGFALRTNRSGDAEIVAVNTTGTEGDDELVGTDGSDTLNGLAGNDRLTGLGGADTLNGGDGFDTADYSGSPSAVTVDLAAGTGRGGDAEGDTLSSIEGVIGSRFADTLSGDGDDFLEGGAGDDILLGGGTGPIGSDVLIGGDGDDRLEAGDTPFGVNVPGSGSDTIVFDFGLAGTQYYAVNYTSVQEGIVIDLPAGEARTGVDGTDTLEGLTGADTQEGAEFYGTAFDDQFISLAGQNFWEFSPGPGTDEIIGEPTTFERVDYRRFDPQQGIEANLSSQVVTGELSGKDVNPGEIRDPFGAVDTASSLDAIEATPHADFLVGDADGTQFRPNAGNDTIVGGAGIDEVRYSNAPNGVLIDLNLADGQVANDGWGNVDTLTDVEFLRLGQFDDAVTGSSEDEIFRGNTGNETIDGGDGDDVIFGNGEFATAHFKNNLVDDDTLDGGAGDDVIDGGRANALLDDGGNDVLTGGDGSDTFVFGRLAGDDVITDFTVGTDQLRLEDGVRFATSSPLQESGGDTTVSLSDETKITLQGVIGLSSTNELDAMLSA